MLLEIKVLVLTITLISFDPKATADIIVQPGYGKDPTQRTPIPTQPLLTPIQHHRESNFGQTQARLIPIYANGHQGGAAYQVGHPLLHYPHYPHYPSYPHYIHAWPRYAPPQRHLRMKLSGRKVFQPLYPGQPTIPLAVHYRYKKSVGDAPDSEKSWDTVPNSKDPSLDKSRSDMMDVEDNNVFNSQSMNDYATAETFLDLDPAHIMNHENFEAKSNGLNERNTDENNELSTEKLESNIGSEQPKQPDTHVSESNSQIPPDEPNLGNFPDPRPDPPEHKTSHKTTPTPIPKKSEEKIPLLGSPMKADEILGSSHVQSEYPTPLLYIYNSVPPQYGNFVPPFVNYLPVYAIRYGACNDDTSQIYGDQQLAIQQQVHQAISATNYPVNTEYVPSIPQTYNYLPSYALGYPKTSSYEPLLNPIPYARYK